MKKVVSRRQFIFLTALFLALGALCFTGRATAQPGDAPESGDSVAVSADVTRKAPLFQENDGDPISVYVLAVCDDPALEAAIRVIAQDKLRSMGHAAVAESMEESSVLLSFAAYRARVGERDHIVYSFAYGAPDTEFVDGTPVSLPRYIYHEATLTRPDELASSINANIAAADSDFIRRLYQGSAIRSNL